MTEDAVSRLWAELGAALTANADRLCKVLWAALAKPLEIEASSAGE